MKSKKGVLSLVIVFFIVTLFLIVFFSILLPMITSMNSSFYEAGEDILENAKVSLNNIEDEDVKSALLNSTEDALASTQTNIEITNGFYEYSWLIIILILTIVFFIYARDMVEVGGAF